MARYEAGLREPRASDVKRLAEILSVSVEEILDGNPTTPRRSGAGGN
ncbi:helix-turn-helix transcriptional regulator [Aminithiophilus ramosus]|uniref:Helix-turn-helix transcriptional regulator n=1 Tax=Aminithiophilus ramosus TaxID=3029084 RepID=A0A9Q7EX07_9BACT|nr:helix-turn-helix transcriptional regulator [Aminithiophilus ramosus]